MLVLYHSQYDMKVLKPLFLGMLGGLILAMALSVGIFFSPLREPIYFKADPEMADIRSKLGKYRDWMAQTDLRIAGDGSATDSLQTAQTKAWRDYKAWRNRLAELARAHSEPTAAGFGPWVYSLRFWLAPLALLFVLIPVIVVGYRNRNLFRSKRKQPAVPVSAKQQARAKALSNFEAAIKKVAQISETEQADSRARVNSPPLPFPSPREEPDTTPIPVTEFTKTSAQENLIREPNPNEPETVPFPIAQTEPHPKDPDRDTAYLYLGPGWGETFGAPGERIGDPASATALSQEMPPTQQFAQPAAQPSVQTPIQSPVQPPIQPMIPAERISIPFPGELAMEDEDSEETMGQMPATTEVERVERRKEEVLKLARKGMTSSEISKRMRISQDQVEFIIRLRREKG